MGVWALSGLLKCWELVCTINGLIHAARSGSSPGILSSLALLSTLVAFTLGRIVFKERQTCIQYFGWIILLGALIGISVFKHADFEFDDNFTPEYQKVEYVTSVLFFIGVGFFWGVSPALWKIGLLRYNVSEHEFAIITIVIGCTLGGTFGLTLDPLSEFFEIPEFPKNLIYIVCVGILTGITISTGFKAAGVGSTQLTQVIISSSPMFQLFLEIVVNRDLPNLVQFIFMLLGILGSALIVLFDVGSEEEEKKALIMKDSSKDETVMDQEVRI